jgi:hypothetical protein
MNAPRLTDWKQTDYYRNFDWQAACQRVTTGSDARVDFAQIPHVWADIQAYKDFYVFNDTQVAAGATVTARLRKLATEADGSVLSRTSEVEVRGRLDLRKGDSGLVLGIEGRGPTWPKAFESAKVIVVSLSHLGQIEPGGKGQMKRLRDLAVRLANENRDALADSTPVYVYGATRGGRGGWAAKTISKYWRADELLASIEPEPLEDSPWETWKRRAAEGVRAAKPKPERITVQATITYCLNLTRRSYLRAMGDDGIEYQWRTSKAGADVGARVTLIGTLVRDRNILQRSEGGPDGEPFTPRRSILLSHVIEKPAEAQAVTA